MTTSTLTAGAALLLTCTTLLSPAYAVAGNVVIAPVRVYLDEISTNAAIELSNPTDEPISMHLYDSARGDAAGSRGTRRTRQPQ